MKNKETIFKIEWKQSEKFEIAPKEKEKLFKKIQFAVEMRIKNFNLLNK